MKRSRIRDGVTVEWGEGDRAFVLLDRTGEAFLSNATAGFILARLREGLSDAQVEERVAAAFDVERSRAKADVAGFLSFLRERGVLDGA